ncbi:MAG: 30S ribosome-binding factor RbfA [Lachnospiraceae bacterium]|nr:30S ribosome-binding factor RbfA [Lachnospiraceae bacterium]
MRKNSNRLTRINEEVLRVLAEKIRGEVKDPRISKMTSVTEVSVAPDLKTCKVYISVLGGDEELENTLKGLKSAEGFLRSALAKEINLRITPTLTFVGDQSIAYGVNMSKLIDEVMAKDAESEE